VCSKTQVIPKGRGLSCSNTRVLDSSWLGDGRTLNRELMNGCPYASYAEEFNKVGSGI
jgi:hypothetical protein